MIYADKAKNESQFVSVNTIGRGRILQPEEIRNGINSDPLFPVQRQTNQSRAPSAEGTEVELNKDEKDVAAEEIQAKTMTTAASTGNSSTNPDSRPESVSSNSLPSGGEPIPEDYPEDGSSDR